MSHTTLPARSAETRTYLPPGWLRGIVAALEAAVAGWLLTMVLAIAAYAGNAAAPSLGEATWASAANVGTSAWLLAHGGRIQLDGSTISLVPLGLTVLAALLVSVAVRRHGLSVRAALFTVVAYMGVQLALVPLAARAVDLPLLVLGSLVVASAGVGWAWLRQRRGALTEELRGRLDPAELTPRGRLEAGGLWVARAVLGGLTVLGVVGLAAVVVGLVAGLGAMRALHEMYDLGVVESLVFALAQAAYLPNLAVWAVSWLAGPGFAVGGGTIVSTTEVTVGPVPAVHALAAVPTEPVGAGLWLALVVVAVGAASAWWATRAGHLSRILDAALGALGVGVVGGVTFGAFAWAASGSIGPGRMARLGVDAVPAGVVVGLELALGALLWALLTHPATRAWVRSALGRARRGMRRGSGGEADGGTGSGGGDGAGGGASGGSAARSAEAADAATSGADARTPTPTAGPAVIWNVTGRFSSLRRNRGENGLEAAAGRV